MLSKMFLNHLAFSFCSFSILIFSILVPSSLSGSPVDNRYAKCAINSTCGPYPIIYPFWETKMSNYCGHPGFMLNCQDNSPTIEILNQTYNVLNIDYDGYVLKISNTAFSNGPCRLTQTQSTNSTLDFTLFNLTETSQNATLFYNCSQAAVAENPPYSFSCQQDGYSLTNLSTSSGFLATEKGWEQNLSEFCKVNVYNPVLKSAVLGLANNSSNITEVLSLGFEVKWNIDDKLCDTCKNSRGVCGYNYTLKQPRCFCKDGAYRTSCNDPGGRVDTDPSSTKNVSKLIIIGVGVAAGGSLILISLLFFMHRYLYKKQRSSPSFGSSDLQIINNSNYFGVLVFSYKELEDATDAFNPLKELGEGGFGTVYYGKLRDGREVAIKRLYEHNNKRTEQFMNEIEILAHLRHKNLVTLFGCTHRQSKELLLVYEYIPNGTVGDHVHGKRSKHGLLAWPMRLTIAIETASALTYLHASDIIHRDVKTQNILLDINFSVKVADFGLSRLFPLDVTHVSTAPQGTPGYVDPEYHQCYQLTEKSDVFSFGVLLAELISSKPAVDITRKRQEINLSSMAINKIENHSLHEFVDPNIGFESDSEMKEEITAVAELAFRCLQSTSEMRPSMEEVLKILLRIKGKVNKVDHKADEVDIPSGDVFMLKNDLSPTSPIRDDNFVRPYIPHASV